MSAACEYKEECLKRHEDMKVLQAAMKTREARDIEIMATMQRIEKTMNDFIKESRDRLMKQEIKTKMNCEDIKKLKDNQWKLATGIITALLAAVWHFLKKYL